MAARRPACSAASADSAKRCDMWRVEGVFKSMPSNTLRVIVAILVALASAGLAPAAPGATKSWIAIDASCSRKTLVEGDRWEVPVDYYLDPKEDDGGTTLYVWV